MERLANPPVQTLNQSALANKLVDNKVNLQSQDKILSEKAGDPMILLGTLSLIGSGVLGGLYRLERQALNLALQDMTVKLKGKEDAMKSLKEKFEIKLSDAKEHLEKELGIERKVSENLGKQIQSLQALLEAVLEETQKQKETLESKLSEEANKGIQLKREFADFEDVVKAMGAALEKENGVSASNKQQLESAQKAIGEAKDNIKIMQQDVEKAKSESETLINEVKDLEKKLETANTKAAGLEAERASLSMSLNEERKVSDKLKDKVNHVDAALGKLSKERDTSDYRAKELEGELASTKAEMLRLQKQVAEMDSAINEAKSSLQNKVAEAIQSSEKILKCCSNTIRNQ